MTRAVPEALRPLAEVEGPRVAAFDADGVLWYGDVSEDFTRWMIDEGHFAGDLWAGYEATNSADPARGCLAILEFYAFVGERAAVEVFLGHLYDFGGHQLGDSLSLFVEGFELIGMKLLIPEFIFPVSIYLILITSFFF